MEEPEAIPSQGTPQPTASPCLDTSGRRQRASLPPPPSKGTTAKHTKRLTLNFPIGVQLAEQDPGQAEQSSSPSSDTMRHSKPVAFPRDRSSTASPSTLLDEHQNDNYPILTAIATQERKVLELREGLQKAEAELTALKREWAVGEKGRKRNQFMHRAEALKPISPTQPSAPGGQDDEEKDEKEEKEEDKDVQKGSAEDKRQSGDQSSTTVSAQTKLSQDLRRQSSVGTSPIESPSGSDSGMSVSARGRTVFQSSRHARNLSLLSATSGPNHKASSPLSHDVQDPRKPDNARGPGLPRSATLPSMDRKDETPNKPNTVDSSSENNGQVATNPWRRSLPPISQDPRTEGFVKTGRQMATDFRDGLWTFIEDIRQATVGEEGINGTGSRQVQSSQTTQRSSRRNGVPSSASRERSAASSRSSKREMPNRTASTSSGNTPMAGNLDVSFWSEFGVDAPEQTPTTTHAKEITEPSDPTAQNIQEETSQTDFDDNWDDWDSTQRKTHTPSSSGSTFPKRDPSPSTNTTTPRTSTSFPDVVPSQSDATSGHNRTNSIPWPALNNFHPSKLTRTASSLMAEWERSLTPPNENTEANAPATTKAGKND